MNILYAHCPLGGDEEAIQSSPKGMGWVEADLLIDRCGWGRWMIEFGGMRIVLNFRRVYEFFQLMFIHSGHWIGVDVFESCVCSIEEDWLYRFGVRYGDGCEIELFENLESLICLSELLNLSLAIPRKGWVLVRCNMVYCWGKSDVKQDSIG